IPESDILAHALECNELLSIALATNDPTEPTTFPPTLPVTDPTAPVIEPTDPDRLPVIFIVWSGRFIFVNPAPAAPISAVYTRMDSNSVQSCSPALPAS